MERTTATPKPNPTERLFNFWANSSTSRDVEEVRRVGRSITNGPEVWRLDGCWKAAVNSADWTRDSMITSTDCLWDSRDCGDNWNDESVGWLSLSASGHAYIWDRSNFNDSSPKEASYKAHNLRAWVFSRKKTLESHHYVFAIAGGENCQIHEHEVAPRFSENNFHMVNRVIDWKGNDWLREVWWCGSTLVIA